MTPSGAEYIRQIKEQITEVDPSEVHELLDGAPTAGANGASANGASAHAGADIALIDVRESEEWDAGHLPGATHVPRGYLESRIEGAVPDRDRRVVIYCASGTRSALAAKTLADLGYSDVQSMTGGITLWKDRGYEVDTPRRLTADQRERYSRHFLLPEIGQAGQEKLLDAKVLLLGAGGLGAPAALYLAAAGVGTIGVIDNDVVDLSNLQRQVIHTTGRIGEKKVDSAEETMKAINPDVNVVKYDFRMDASNIMDVITGYDVIVDGLDNFPTRYLLNDASVRLQIPVVSASILGFDGQLGLQALRRAVLPLPVPGPAARRARPELRRQRRARRAAGHDGAAAGDRGHQADRRHRRAAGRPAAALRGPRRHVHRAQGPPRPRVPGVLAPARGHLRRGDGRVPRLRGVLRRRWLG
ncbi:MAG: ThiF family adenylyltransferase [Solirubrobacterales bacterium]